MPPLLPDEDKNFGGSLVLDFRKWWRHVKTIYSDLFSYLSQREWTSASTKVNCWNLSVVTCETFQGYRETVFLPYVINQLRNVERLDVVWDRYLSSSLKILHGAREERVSVEASDRTPGSQEIREPPWGSTRTNRNFFFTDRCKAWVHSCNCMQCRCGCCSHRSCKIPVHFQSYPSFGLSLVLANN